MRIELVMDNWVIDEEYFITESVSGYTVYNCGTEDIVAEEQFSSESFEECLTWVWESI